MTDWPALLAAPAPERPVEPGPLPTLSVLIPAYNAAGTIGEAVESALTQRPKPLEVVVSDDGSEDDLDSALVGFGARVQVVRGPNRGLATARNRAAAAARGELLGMLDADDVWLPGRAAALTQAAAWRPDLSIVTTDAVIVRDGRTEAGTYYAARTFEVGDQAAGVLRSNFVFGAGAVRAQALADVGGYDPLARWAEDWDLWLRLLLRGHRAGLVQAPLYEYRRHASSLTSHKVDLAVGVLAALERARPLVAGPGQLAMLAATERRWRCKAARASVLGADPRRRRLTWAAARLGAQPARARFRLAASCLLPDSWVAGR